MDMEKNTMVVIITSLDMKMTTITEANHKIREDSRIKADLMEYSRKWGSREWEARVKVDNTMIMRWVMNTEIKIIDNSNSSNSNTNKDKVMAKVIKEISKDRINNSNNKWTKEGKIM